ncbi:hypothetical protein [uncultured Brevundimonas sp.]|uniref:hypothetical protein n=1 Tax=uncultured Brevundimonas sp. TaxID=213418 RepID=UPI0025F35B68|nr:hypothetical protein [uncultured Brevundimonas sp.]
MTREGPSRAGREQQRIIGRILYTCDEGGEQQGEKWGGREVHDDNVPEPIRLRTRIAPMAVVRRHCDADKSRDRHECGHNHKDQEEVCHSHRHKPYVFHSKLALVLSTVQTE